MANTAPNASDRYAHQLRQGFRDLRFAAELEAEYLAASEPSFDRQAIIAGYVGTLVWMLYVLMDQLRLDLWQRYPNWVALDYELLSIRGTVLACFGVSLMAFHHPGRWLNRRGTVAGMLYLLSLGSTVAMALYAQRGISRDSSVLLLLVMAMFLPLGLSLRQCLLLALSAIGSVVAVGVLMPDPQAPKQYVQVSLSMGIATIVGALGAYLREYSHREQFLLRGELEWLARRDALTGLHNRRAFNEHLETTLRAAHREGRRIGLLMIDVDHFKPFNDSQGHAAGDLALQRIAEVIQRAAARPLDMAARTGGEELAVVLYDVSTSGLQRMARRILDEVRALGIAHPALGEERVVSVSIGATHSTPQDNAGSLYKRADQLLYQAKHLGRGRAQTDLTQIEPEWPLPP